MSEKEKNLAYELFTITAQLNEADLEHLLWISQGILFASKTQDARA